ncbi:hypothetical protein BD414DRAFT_211642 [Trametes punicea]|nr:hypothetical protein BD414DRAFT_211642 [Trametes punicea]
MARTEQEDEAESDMEMSLPASPMRVHSPVALTALDGVSKVKGLHEGEVTNMSGTERDRTASEDVEDAADTSDMDMSPPASPAISPAVVPVGAQPSSSTASPVVEGQKNEPVRPSLVIDTSVASPQLSRAGIRQRPPPSSTASTPPPVGDESDMEMSSPTSSAAPSPLPASPLLVARDLPRPPSSRGPPASSLGISGEKPSGAVAAVPTSRPDAAEPTATSKLSVPDRRDEAASPQIPPPVFSSPMSAATTPRVAALRDHAADRAQTSASASPRLRRTTASMERLHVEAGELSPPVSEETLREETEGLEKEADSAMRLEKETPPGPRRQAGPPVAQDVLIEPQKLTDIPLSEALRMVVRLRMMFPRQSQEERVEPVIMSNRHIAEPEEPDAPAAEALVVSVLEKERGQLSGGAFDGTKHSLRKRFAEHQAALAEKVERLRKEYLALHEKWMVHCSKLDEVSRANALEEAAATAGRTTRRSTAMGDAVRTDLEMEQILASLGNEELTDANHLSAKNAAMIPDMVSVTKGHFNVVFDDTNNLVEDPQSYYALETGIDDWTEEEKAIFLEKYAMYPKQFGIIADFLPNKTPAQCVTFYYLHKNTTIDFRKVVAQFNTAGKRNRRGRGGKQKGNALLADILKHDDEVSRNLTLNTTSGRRRRAPPPAPAPTGPVPELEARSSTAASAEQLKKGTGSRRSTTQNTPTGTPAPDPEAAAKRPRRRANPSAKAVAAMGQDNGDDEVDEDVRPVKRSRKSRKTKAGDSETTSVIAAEDASVGSATPGETRFIDQTELTARKKTAGGGAIWSDEDKALFLKLLAQHGDDFKRIAASMPNKTTIQVTSFYKANLDEMQLGKVAAKAPKRSRSPTPSGSASRVTTPSLSVKPTTPGAEHGFATDGNLHAPSDNGVESVANSNVSGLPSSSAPSGTPSDPPYPAASVDAFHHFQTPGGSSDMLVSSPLPRSGSSHDAHTQSPAGMGTPSTLTTTFPTFYSNLGPSNFAGGQVPPSAFARLAAPQTGGGANVPPMIMEFSDFAPQPWTTAPLSHDGQPQGGNGPQAPGLPTALATTEDLVRYLEHRTRLTAGQNTDTDFM